MQFRSQINKFNNYWIKNWIVVVCLQSDSKVGVAQLKMKTNMNTKINIAPAFVAAMIASLYSYSHSCSHSFGCRYRSWLLWKSVEYPMHPAQLTGFFIFHPVAGMGISNTWIFIRIHLIQRNIVLGIDLNYFSLLRLLGGEGNAFVQTFFDIAEDINEGLFFPLSLARIHRNWEDRWTKFLKWRVGRAVIAPDC
jgi:hypothetical protein